MDTSDDPITIAAVASTGLSVAGKIKEGKELEQIAKQRAAVDRAAAARNDKRTRAGTKMLVRKGRSAIATRRSNTAKNNIVVGQGSPAVVESQMTADFLQDINTFAEAGELQSQSLLASADLEERQGKRLRRASVFAAFKSGLAGASQVGGRLNDTGFFDENDPFALETA